jgi:hypothetical protein
MPDVVRHLNEPYNPIQNLMVRLFSILLLTTFIGCASSKQFSHQDIIEEKSDDSGRVILKKYRQLISHPAHNKLATITQEYDTFGRVTKEYGFNNPYYQSAKYLTENIYQGTKVFIRTTFLWDNTDTSSDFKNYDKRFFEQVIYPDSVNINKVVTILMTSKNKDIFTGYFSETFPTSPTTATVKSYTFELDLRNIRFDQNRKLVLDDIKVR